jgi:hypothetical protein
MGRGVIDAITIALALQSRLPLLPPARIEHFATAIARAAADDPDASAALIVNLERETRGSYAAERCAISGLGGWGSWGVAPLWERWYPGGTCGPIEKQARAATAVWLAGWRHERGDVRRAFGRYIGATAVGRHPEAKRRMRIWYSVRASIECNCSTEG